MQQSTMLPATYTRFDDIPHGLRTRTAWRSEGRKVRAGATAKGYYDSYWYKTSYELFSLDDTVATSPRRITEGRAVSFAEDFVVAAIQTINDAAKRRRDSATKAYLRRQHGRARNCSDAKSEYYDLKDRVLARLLSQGRARVIGHHSKTDWFEPPKRYLGPSQFDGFGFEPFDEFDDWDHGLCDSTSDDGKDFGEQTTILEVVEFAGRQFHRPVDYPSPDITADAHLGDRLSPARPLGIVRLRDAVATLRAYLEQPLIILPAVVTSVIGSLPEGELIRAIGVPWLAILDELNRNPSFLFEFVRHPRNFEEFVAASYDKAGYDVSLTPRSGDSGRDVIAIKPGHLSVRILDQCKAYSPGHAVAANDVRAMLGVITGDQNTSKGVITTTATFAPGIGRDPILAPYLPHRLELRDGRRLREWLLTLVDASTVNF